MKESYTIFVIEDEDIFREMLVDELTEMERLNVYAFATGEEALEHFNLDPDIVVLDHYLNKENPDAKSGMEIIDDIKRHSPYCKIIVLSTALSDVMFDYLMKKDVHSYIVKEDNAFEELKNQIDEIIYAS